MIDRELLEDIGFLIGNGWDHEVWVYDGNFWVHFGGTIDETNNHVHNTVTRKKFFEAFISAIRKGRDDENHWNMR